MLSGHIVSPWPQGGEALTQYSNAGEGTCCTWKCLPAAAPRPGKKRRVTDEAVAGPGKRLPLATVRHSEHIAQQRVPVHPTSPPPDHAPLSNAAPSVPHGASCSLAGGCASPCCGQPSADQQPTPSSAAVHDADAAAATGGASSSLPPQVRLSVYNMDLVVQKLAVTSYFLAQLAQT